MRLPMASLGYLAIAVSCGCGSSDLGAPASRIPAEDGGSSPLVVETASDGGSGGEGGATSDSGACRTAVVGGMFSAPNPWTKDVSCDPVDPSSKTITDALTAAGGWGPGAKSFQIDTSLVVLRADASTPMVPFYRAPGYYTPDCDVFSVLPLPAGGAIEGVSGYTCNTAAGDCHLLIVYPKTQTLYEIYQATQQGSGIVGGCGVLWDLTKSYPASLRGDQCTSADAAGLAMSAMLPDADEVASGAVLHAMRFALPNDRIRAGVYVHPASHAGGPKGGARLPPYGVRMRLRADYPVASLRPGAAQVLATALQRFGMFLSDGGNIPLMVQGDQFTAHKWKDLNFDTRILFGIAPGDFEVVDMGPTVALTDNCVRNP
jgi:hypothetical protein